MISVVPPATAVTIPVASIVAIEVFELLHAPPPSPLLEYCAVAPIQSGDDPLTTPGLGSRLTVRFFDELTGDGCD